MIKMNLMKVCLVSVLVCHAAAANKKRENYDVSSECEDDPLVESGNQYESNFLQKGIRSCFGWVGWGFAQCFKPAKEAWSYLKEKSWGPKVAGALGLGTVGLIGYGVKSYLPSWMGWGLTAMTATTVAATAQTAYGLVASPEKFADDLANSRWNTWALRAVTKTTGLALGYEADAEVMLLAKGIAIAKQKIDAKLKIQMHMSGDKKLDPAALKKEKENQRKFSKELRNDEGKGPEGVCYDILSKLQRSKTGSCFIMGFFKMIISFVPSDQISMDDLNKYSDKVISWLNVGILDSVFCGLCCMKLMAAKSGTGKITGKRGDGTDIREQTPEENSLVTMIPTLMLPFGRIMTQMKALKNKDAADEQRKKNAANKSATVAPVKLAAGGADTKEKPQADLKAVAQSAYASETSSQIMMVMLGVSVVLLGALFFIVKGMGNPGDSEYPEKLGNTDLNKAEQMV